MTNPKLMAYLYFAAQSTASGTGVHMIVLYGLTEAEVENIKKFLADSGGGLFEAQSHYYKPGGYYNLTYQEKSYWIPAGKVMYAEFIVYDHINVA